MHTFFVLLSRFVADDGWLAPNGFVAFRHCTRTHYNHIDDNSEQRPSDFNRIVNRNEMFAWYMSDTKPTNAAATGIYIASNKRAVNIQKNKYLFIFMFIFKIRIEYLSQFDVFIYPCAHKRHDSPVVQRVSRVSHHPKMHIRFIRCHNYYLFNIMSDCSMSTFVAFIGRPTCENQPCWMVLCFCARARF